MSTIITKKQFNNHIYKTEIAGRPFSLEFGKVAELANASAMVRYGDTSVLVAVTAAPRPRDGVDFFPLSVDFEEKLYAVPAPLCAGRGSPLCPPCWPAGSLTAPSVPSSLETSATTWWSPAP